jgi:hypothetical protein
MEIAGIHNSKIVGMGRLLCLISSNLRIRDLLVLSKTPTDDNKPLPPIIRILLLQFDLANNHVLFIIIDPHAFIGSTRNSEGPEIVDVGGYVSQVLRILCRSL